MKNIGRVAEADIEINGIAVIAGENGTGKSTVGKALYAAFNSMSDSENKIDRMRRNSVERAIRKAYVGGPLDSTSRHRRTAGRMNGFIDRVFSGECTRDELIDEIKEYYGEEISREIESDFTNGVAGVADQIIEIMDISDDEVFRAIATNRFQSEFNGQINSVFGEEPGKVELQIKDASTVFSVAGDEVAEVLDKTGRSKEDKELLAQIENRLSTIARLGRAFGIHLILATQRPDANIGPAFRFRPLLGHQEELRQDLIQATIRNDDSESSLFDEIAKERHLKVLMDKVSSLCPGYFERSESRGHLTYLEEGFARGLEPGNLSAGLKTFAIMKALLKSGALDAGGTIILDEPEIHLHPAWQLAFAEIIVLLQKELGMHVLMSTHSPYFLNAIEVYSKKHAVDGLCSYYLAETCADGRSRFAEITGSTEVAYEKLAAPFDTLEREEYGLE